jgi:hypothetical protein
MYDGPSGKGPQDVEDGVDVAAVKPEINGLLGRVRRGARQVDRRSGGLRVNGRAGLSLGEKG